MSNLLTDDNVLRVAAVAVGVDAVNAGLFPERFRKRYFDINMPNSAPHTRWMGLALAGFAAQTLAPTLGGNTTAKRNALKVWAATAATASVRKIVLMRSKHEKKSGGVGFFVAQVALISAALYQAFKE